MQHASAALGAAVIHREERHGRGRVGAGHDDPPHCSWQGRIWERVIRMPKTQCVHCHRSESQVHAFSVIPDWISFYNQRRRHRAPTMMTSCGLGRFINRMARARSGGPSHALLGVMVPRKQSLCMLNLRQVLILLDRYGVSESVTHSSWIVGSADAVERGWSAQGLDFASHPVNYQPGRMQRRQPVLRRNLVRTKDNITHGIPRVGRPERIDGVR